VAVHINSTCRLMFCPETTSRSSTVARSETLNQASWRFERLGWATGCHLVEMPKATGYPCSSQTGGDHSEAAGERLQGALSARQRAAGRSEAIEARHGFGESGDGDSRKARQMEGLEVLAIIAAVLLLVAVSTRWWQAKSPATHSSPQLELRRLTRVCRTTLPGPRTDDTLPMLQIEQEISTSGSSR
jgi:hypothetical protein